jgi:hypothetical protein
MTGQTGTVQYRVIVGKKEPDLVSGPDDADVVISVPLDHALTDPTVAYMQGKLKPVGHSGILFEVLASGEAAANLRSLVNRA